MDEENVFDLNSEIRDFPIVIPGILPFRNTLKAFQEKVGFARLWQQVASREHAFIKIIQIGAGGTGGFLAAEIMRFIGSLPKEMQERIQYVLIDGDKFEAKNISRQLCTEDDIGYYKAQSIVERCIDQYNCVGGSCSYINKYITSPEDFTNLGVLNCTRGEMRYYVAPSFGADSDYTKYVVPSTSQEVLNEFFSKCNEFKDKSDQVNTFYRYINNGLKDKDGNIKERSIATLHERGCFPMIGYPGNKNQIIFLDCVDKTTVRNILYQVIKSLNVGISPYDCVCNNILNTTLINRYRDDWSTSQRSSGNANDLYDGIKECNVMFCGYDTAIPVFNFDDDAALDYAFSDNIYIYRNMTHYGAAEKERRKNISKNRAKAIVKSGTFTLPVSQDTKDQKPLMVANMNLISPNGLTMSFESRSWDYTLSFNDRPDIYLISSGNGEYVGQVSWGRTTTYLPDSSPVTIKDIFGEDRSKCVSPVVAQDSTEDIYPIYRGNFYKDFLNAFDDGADVTCIDDWFAWKNNFGHELAANKNSGRNQERSFIRNNYPKLGVLSGKPTFDINTEYREGSTTVCYRKKYFKINYPKDVFYKNLLANYYALKSIRRKKLCALSDGPIEWYVNGELFNLGTSSSISIPGDILNDYTIQTIKAALYDNSRFPLYISSSCGDIIDHKDLWKNFETYASRYISVPIPYDVYPALIDLEEDKREEQMSCAQRAVENVQSINANKTAANLMFNYFTTIMNGMLGLKSEAGGEVTLDNYSVYFDTRTNTMIPSKITIDFLYDRAHEFAPNFNFKRLAYLRPYRPEQDRNNVSVVNDIEAVGNTSLESSTDTNDSITLEELQGE